MSKILISWMAYENDFIKGKGIVNADGPNSTVHKYFFRDYDHHLLLTTSKDTNDDTKYQYLVTYLRSTFNHTICEIAMSINDVIDLSEISAKVNTLLLSNKQLEIDIFISPGTPTMQVAWYLAHQSLGIKTNLFQLRRMEHSKNKLPEQLFVTLEKSSYTAALIIKQYELDRGLKVTDTIILGSLKDVYVKADKVARHDHIRVLITGDTGTGKELLAQYIHEHSPRKGKPFEAINCSALGDQLLESRLFGYEKGAFTGADKTTLGLFHELDGGTAFLDEIGDISPYMQQLLLRFLQSGEVLKVGSRKTDKVDVRIIAATNKNVMELVTQNKFREDLYYRLSVSEFNLPSLKEYRSKDKEQIFNYLWKKSIKKFNSKGLLCSNNIRKQILEYPFPGNIREMENMIDGIIAESDDEVKIDHLPNRVLKPKLEQSLKLKDVENRHIHMVYEICNKNMTRTSKVLGVSYNKVKSKLNI